ncbi:hypothetical protein PACTADRAFT_40792, partial [Pachysolen tannophilus NRRL Y-2460]
MQLLINEKSRVIALVSRTYILLFQHMKDESNKVRIELQSKESFNDKHFKKFSKHKIHGFLGLINVNDDVFLCVITGKAEVANPLPGQTVNKIFAVEFHCLNRNTWDFIQIDNNGYPSMSNFDPQNSKQRFEQHPCFELRKLLGNGSFYYSSDFDLTSALQSRGVTNDSLSLDDFQQQYMWNSFMMKQVISFRNQLGSSEKNILDYNGFLTTVIRGFAETFQTHIKNLKTQVTIISKQSWKRAGTRFNARGIDDDGNVANFVETEFILSCNKVVYSFTEVRGSVPVFWEQDTALISPKVAVTRSKEATQPVFEKHFHGLFEKYGPVHVVNLLSKTKPSEYELSKRYKSHVTTLSQQDAQIAYTEFDFHAKAGKNFELANKIIPMLENSLLEFGYFSYDLINNEILTHQTGVFRVNCLDCLDRTNVIQQLLSNCALNLFFKDNNIPTSYEMDLVTKHNTLWADNGDAISQIYTGTNALKSSYTRSGKMGFAGMLSDATKSVSRMYINNFQDKGKQMTIDTLLGKLENQVPVQIFDPINDYVIEELDKFSSKFTKYTNITVFTGTYNLAGVSKVGDLTEWLFPQENNGISPDIVILGFQEVLELNAQNLINNDKSQSVYWQKVVGDQLNSGITGDTYVLLRAEQMTSIMLLFFVKSDKMPFIKNVEGATKKTGLGGMAANKGGVALRFDYSDSSFCVVNSHLAAGVKAIEERCNDFETISNGISFSRGKKVKDHESVIWLGDLNFRIDLSNEEVRSCISSSNLNYLLQYDQLKHEMNVKNGFFKKFFEAKIDFKPTYKFDKMSNYYDSSEKARVPSWTDRVIYYGKNLHQLNYNSCETIMFSDHRPVYGTFEAKVKIIDQALRHKIKHELYMNYKGAHKDELNSGSLIDLEDLEGSSPSLLSDSRETSSLS